MIHLLIKYANIFIHFFISIVLCWSISSCGGNVPNRSGLQAATALPTLDESSVAGLCAAVSEAWGSDWARAIRALTALREQEARCDDGLAIDGRLYTAYVAYGTQLEQEGRREEAIAAYEAAFAYDQGAAEARQRLALLGVATTVPPERCDPSVVTTAIQAMPVYTPMTGSYVTISGERFALDGAPYPVHGAAYYPRDYPYQRFLTEADPQAMEAELDLLRSAGINTIRMFLWLDGLFTCPGNGAVPVVESFARLDALIAAASARSIRIIAVLNDLPDLSVYPLYSSPSHTQDQIGYVVERYANEPTIMAWDLRDSGDVDYRGIDGFGGSFPQEQVMTWLAETALLVRQRAPNQLITAGWRRDSEATIPVVDFVSFQHYGDINELRQRIANLQAATDKPILLAGVGYSTYTLDEDEQRTGLQLAMQATRTTGLAGWVIWMAFDLPLNRVCIEEGCTAEDSPNYHYGLWNTSYFPKLALDAVLLTTGGE
jgi:hypothetical protein